MDRGAWWATVQGAQRVRHDWVHTNTHATALGGRWYYYCCCCLVAKLCLTFVTPWTIAHQAPVYVPSGKNTGVGCHFVFQGIFPTQGLNPCLLHWQGDSLPLSQMGSLLLLLLLYKGKKLSEKKANTFPRLSQRNKWNSKPAHVLDCYQVSWRSSLHYYPPCCPLSRKVCESRPS